MVSAEPRLELSWWSDVSPSLMTNKSIRNFLLAYSEGQHPEVVKLMTLYGILSLQGRYGAQPFGIGEIRKLLKEEFLGQTLDRKLDSVKHSVNDIQHVLEEFALGVDTACEGLQQAPSARRLLRLDTTRDSEREICQPEPSSATLQEQENSAQADCLQKEAHGPEEERASEQKVHPAWWHFEASNQPPATPRLLSREGRPPPRLSHSRAGRVGSKSDPVADDVVDPRHLLMPPTASLHTPRTLNLRGSSRQQTPSPSSKWR